MIHRSPPEHLNSFGPLTLKFPFGFNFVRRILSFERLLHTEGHSQEFEAVMDEYFQTGHAQPVPEADLEKPKDSVFYLPIHVVQKESSMATKVRAVFDASA